MAFLFLMGHRPFYDKVTITLPNTTTPLVISSHRAPTDVYVKSLAINGQALHSPIIMHTQLANGGEITYEMSETPELWANGLAFGAVKSEGGVVSVLFLISYIFGEFNIPSLG